MKTVSQNARTLSASIVIASKNDQSRLVVTLVLHEQRTDFWPQRFGLIPQWVTLEPRVLDWMDHLCEDYCGGI